MDDDRHAFIWVCAGRQFGHACIGGTRVPALQMAELWWNDGAASASALCDAYDITIGQLLEACWFAARYGGRRWRARWQAWADSPAFEQLWHADYAADLLPPQKRRTE